MKCADCDYARHDTGWWCLLPGSPVNVNGLDNVLPDDDCHCEAERTARLKAQLGEAERVAEDEELPHRPVGIHCIDERIGG